VLQCVTALCSALQRVSSSTHLQTHLQFHLKTDDSNRQMSKKIVIKYMPARNLPPLGKDVAFPVNEQLTDEEEEQEEAPSGA